MTSINTTIQSALPSALAGHPEAARATEAVTSALVERERAMSAAIVEAVTSHFRVPAHEVESRLASLGMELTPEPEPEPELVSDSFIGTDAIAEKREKKGGKLARRVKRLEQIAREHGLLRS